MAMRGWPLIKLLPVKTDLKFVKFSKAFGAFSAVLVIASLIGVFYPGLNMGIDFRGGASMEVSKPAGQVIALDELRGAVADLGLGDVGVQGIRLRVQGLAGTNIDWLIDVTYTILATEL